MLVNDLPEVRPFTTKIIPAQIFLKKLLSHSKQRIYIIQHRLAIINALQIKIEESKLLRCLKKALLLFCVEIP